MKKLLLIFSAAAMLLAAGCNQSNEGGTSDQYNSSHGAQVGTNHLQHGTNAEKTP